MVKKIVSFISLLKIFQGLPKRLRIKSKLLFLPIFPTSPVEKAREGFHPPLSRKQTGGEGKGTNI